MESLVVFYCRVFMKIFGSNRREAVSGMCNLLNEQLVTLNQMWNLERGIGGASSVCRLQQRFRCGWEGNIKMDVKNVTTASVAKDKYSQVSNI
jgi:hypothetical protein